MKTMNTVILFPGQKQRSMCSIKCVFVQLINIVMALAAVVMFYVIVEGDKKRRGPNSMPRYSMGEEDDFGFSLAHDLESGDAHIQLAGLQERMQQSKRDAKAELEKMQRECPTCGQHDVNNGAKAPAKTSSKRQGKKASKSGGSRGSAEKSGNPDEASSQCESKDGQASCKTCKGKAGKKPNGKARRSRKKAQLSTWASA